MKAPALSAAAPGLEMLKTRPTAMPGVVVGLDSDRVNVGGRAAAAMVMLPLCVALGTVPLPTCTVKPNAPAAVGVPLKTPVLALRVTPGGKLPATNVQVKGVVPVAMKLWV